MTTPVKEPGKETADHPEGYVRREREIADKELIRLAHELEERGGDPIAALRWYADMFANKE